MVGSFHFFRPLFLTLLIPWISWVFLIYRKKNNHHALQALCDAHLLPFLIQDKKHNNYRALFFLFLSGCFIIFALAGPSRARQDLPIFHIKEPTVIALSISDNMHANDLYPERLTRAKFKLTDFFKTAFSGEVGLLLYTGEAFVASPLTEDGNTILTLMQEITFDVMPTKGDDAAKALEEADTMIKAAGYTHGKIILMTATPPDLATLKKAETLKKQGIITAIMPVVGDENLAPLFEPFSKRSGGPLLLFQDEKAFQSFFNFHPSTQFEKKIAAFAAWKDEGNIAILIALLFFLPLFQKGVLRGLL